MEKNLTTVKKLINKLWEYDPYSLVWLEEDENGNVSLIVREEDIDNKILILGDRHGNE